MVERKSYGRRDRLFTVEVDPQLTLNLWVLAQNGIPCVGIVFDGIYTYRWKPEKPTQAVMMETLLTEGPVYTTLSKTELRERAKWAIESHPGIDRPPVESFDRLYLDRTSAHIDAALDEVRASIQRRNALRRGATPQRNISSWCKSCAQRPVCWERLAFPVEDALDGVEVED
jgi:hypothetical protein